MKPKTKRKFLYTINNHLHGATAAEMERNFNGEYPELLIQVFPADAASEDCFYNGCAVPGAFRFDSDREIVDIRWTQLSSRYTTKATEQDWFNGKIVMRPAAFAGEDGWKKAQEFARGFFRADPGADPYSDEGQSFLRVARECWHPREVLRRLGKIADYAVTDYRTGAEFLIRDYPGLDCRPYRPDGCHNTGHTPPLILAHSKWDAACRLTAAYAELVAKYRGNYSSAETFGKWIAAGKPVAEENNTCNWRPPHSSTDPYSHILCVADLAKREEAEAAKLAAEEAATASEAVA